MHRLPKIARVGDWRGMEKKVCVSERGLSLLSYFHLFCSVFEFSLAFPISVFTHLSFSFLFLYAI